MARKSRKAARTARISKLKKEYRELANEANARMRALEQLAKNPEYKAVLGYAYKDVLHDLEALTGRKRFLHNIERLSAKNTDIRHLTALINVAKTFLDSPSSTKEGIDQVYGKRADTINEKFGTNFTSEDMKTFFESSVWEKLKDRLGSPVAMLVINKIQKEPNKILEDIEASRQKHQRVNIESLNIDNKDVNKELTTHDRHVIEKLAKIYAGKG